MCDNDSDLRTDAFPSPPRNIVPDEPVTNSKSEENIENTYHKPSISKDRKKRPKTAKLSASNSTMVNVCNSSNVHVGDVNNYNISNAKNGQPEGTTQKIIRTEAINNLMTSVQLVEEQHIDFVSGHITVDSWMKVAQGLQFSTGQIQQLHKRCESRGIREVVYNMLMEWKQKEPTLATLGKLGTVLWDNMEEEAAARLANKLFSANK